MINPNKITPITLILTNFTVIFWTRRDLYDLKVNNDNINYFFYQ